MSESDNAMRSRHFDKNKLTSIRRRYTDVKLIGLDSDNAYPTNLYDLTVLDIEIQKKNSDSKELIVQDFMGEISQLVQDEIEAYIIN